MSSQYTNLVRFLDEAGVEHYGDVAGDLNNIAGSEVTLLEGSLFDLKRTNKAATVQRLLAPVPAPPLFVCVGLNYADHTKEANLAIPPNPVIFTKPADALADPYADIPIPAQAKLMDYEGELCIVIGKTGKDIPAGQALDHVLGLTAGNDLSSRYWQRPPYSGGQYCYAKSFDNFAPLGPTLLHVSRVSSSLPLVIKTTVNGEVRQNGSTADMLFDVAQIIAHASQGTTLRQGTVIMTGTPAGIAARMAGEPWLQDGDVVEVEITKIGRLRNKLVKARR